VSDAQRRALSILLENHGGVTVRAAHRTSSDRKTVGWSTVRVLERKGLVRVEQDGATAWVRLTAVGRATAEVYCA